MWNIIEVNWGYFEILVKGLLLIFFTCVPLLILKIGQEKNLDSHSTILCGPIFRRTLFHETLDPQPHPGSGDKPQGQHSGMPRIVSAVKKGKYNAVLEELNKGVPIDTEDSEGATPLYWSSCRGDVSLTRFLIGKGANVNHKVKWESTPLHAAADRGHTECVECLLNWGANVNAQNSNHDTPLHLAAYRGYYEVCLLLLAYNASLNLENFKGKTPCQEAKEAGHTKIGKILANNNKGGTFPLENKTIGDVYRNRDSSAVWHSYGRQLSEQQYSERHPDISFSEPILGATCGHSGHHSFPNLNMLTSFSTNFKEDLPYAQRYNHTITKLNSLHSSNSSLGRHPPIDDDMLQHLNQCSPSPAQRPLYTQGGELFTKIEDLELRLATAESLSSTMGNENTLLRRENALLREEISSYELRVRENECSHCSSSSSNLGDMNLAESVAITELKEDFKNEQSLRLAAESRSRQAMKDMFTLRGRLDELSSQRSEKSYSNDYSHCDFMVSDRLNKEPS